MSAYAETYVPDAQGRLGMLLDFAVNGLAVELSEAYARFLKSSVSVRLEAGDPAIVAGRSGEELALEVLGSTLCSDAKLWKWVPTRGASPEFWTGWALAFYQWASGYSFAAIQRRIDIEDVRSLYVPYHEMDVRQFCDRMDELARDAHPQTNLQTLRLAAGLSQRQLAKASGVPVRTLQQYEQRQKSINRARADYVLALSRALSCYPADLLEREARSGYQYAAVSL